MSEASKKDLFEMLKSEKQDNQLESEDRAIVSKYIKTETNRLELMGNLLNETNDIRMIIENAQNTLEAFLNIYPYIEENRDPRHSHIIDELICTSIKSYLMAHGLDSKDGKHVWQASE